MSRPLKLAVVCGAVPLFLGTLIYLTWRFTRWQWLEIAGMLLIPVGVVFFAVGYAYLLKGLPPEKCRSGRARISALAIGGLLFANFPTAAFFTWSAIDVTTRYTVEVVNESGHVIDSFVLNAPGVRVELDPIQNGRRTRTHLHVQGEGGLDFSARQKKVEISGKSEAYVTSNLGGYTTIRLMPNGIYEVHDKVGN